ncbi:MAG TPA: histidine kinase [Terriglobales bacterium]|nr:histidine kinase [Terriglobales bacterium]
MEQRLILINLLIKLGVAAAVASTLVRSVEFKNLLFREDRSLKQKIYLVLWIAGPLALGVWFRLSAPRSFLAGDLSFETAILLGVIGGRLTGALGGCLVGLPAVLHGEWATLPFTVLCGLVAGQLRAFAPDREDIWSFSPFIDLSIYRMIRRNLPAPRRFDWQVMFFVTIVALRFMHTELSRFLPHATFSLESPKLWVESLIYATSIIVIGTALKIWNSVRIQIKLEEQERLLLSARMEALQNQINPHFLFNTLNSVSSLVRFDPDTARELIIKLATILRRLLNSSDAFVPLREELEFIDNYLDIEVVRFGPDKLQVVKELDPASLDAMVPSMLLQPLIENSIKHGLASRIEEGRIFLRSRLTDSRLIIEVEDNGVGMGSANLLERPTGLGGTGIGLANVAERLKVLYGDTARMTIDSHEGKGTLVRLRLPVLQSEASIPAAAYEERSSIRR